MLASRTIEQNLGLSAWRVGRVAQLLLLSGSVLAYCIVAMSAANSLFLDRVGADKLPLCFTLLGLFSTVAYAVISQVVDRFSRPQLFRYALIFSLSFSVLIWFLLPLNWPATYFILSVVSFFQWDLGVNILFPNLLSDYFTSLEYKRYAPYIGIAQAAGMLVGGGITALMSRFISTENFLIGVTPLYVLAFGQLVYLEISQRRLDGNRTSPRENFWQSLKALPKLSQRYPIVPFQAASTFAIVIVYVISEYLWFSVYSDNFSEAELTGFLGTIRIATSIVQVVALYCFTRPLLQRLGVGRMNVVYPVTTLLSFFGLAVGADLRAAILLNVNGDSLNKGINSPVHQLNFNAIPPEFSGRIRALSDGFFYALGLTVAGLLLAVARTYLSFVQITWIAIGLTVGLLVLRLPLGKYYASGLEDMIRSDAIGLDDFEYGAQLPSQSGSAIRELLADGDRVAQLKGLELAANLGKSSQFLPEVLPLLANADRELRDAIVKLFGTSADGEAIAEFEKLLAVPGERVVRATALEVLIANAYSFEEAQLRYLLRESDPEIRILAAVAATQMGLAAADSRIQATCEQMWLEDLGDTAVITAIRAITYSGDRDLVALIPQIIARSGSEAQRVGLEALAGFARRGDVEVAELAVAKLQHPEPLVRAAAYNLLGITRCKGMLRFAAIGLGDADPRVRQNATVVLAAYGSQGLSLAQDSLSSSNPEVVNAAIAAIGQVRTRNASNILFAHLTPDFQEVAKTRRWQQQIPTNDRRWQPLSIAIADYHQRTIQKVLYVLSCLGHSRTVNTVNQILYGNDARGTANAVEVLASISNRRFVLPLLPILEKIGSKPSPSRVRSSPQWLRSRGYKVLLEALESRDRWIQIGALIALAMVPATLMRDSDPLVKDVARQIFLPAVQRPMSFENAFMNRLLLLKNVALFKNLSLDELLLIDKALEPEQVLAGRTIFAEGSWGTHLYIIAEGSVQIVKEIDEEPREIRRIGVGEYFGELALFDDAPRWDGAVALKDCTLLKLEKERFIRLITQRPPIILEICRFLSQRLRETDNYRSARKLMPPAADDGVEVPQ